MKTVITVPHSLCVSGLDHLCDYMAPKAAMLLKDKLNAKVFLADANRVVIDYNRKNSRDSYWRKNIRNYVLNNQVNLVLDIHSYPNETTSFGSINGKIPDIVILDSFNGGNDVLSKKLTDHLNSKGILTKLIPGGDNDISIEMRELNVKSLLIEFSEGLTQNKLEMICESIKTFFL